MMRVVVILAAFLVGAFGGAVWWLWPQRPEVTFSGEPQRGAFAPGPSSSDTGPATYQCLVAVTGDPAVWHYRVWREGDPSKALTGKGAVVVPQ